MLVRRLASFLLLAATAPCVAQNWPQGPGPNGDFTSSFGNAPTEWSVALDRNIAWRTELPETGQSSPVIWGDSVFLTTMKPVSADSEIGADIVAWRLSATDGSVIWKRDIPGGYQTKLSAPFGDASSPAPVTDGEHVWFLNPTGRLSSFDFDGDLNWSREIRSVVRTRPVLHNGLLLFHRHVYLPDEVGHFTAENKEAPLEKWTQLQAVDAATGKVRWTSECGVNMGALPLVQKREDGLEVLVVGRGGGHGPPEKPEGVSMIRADNGKTLWTLPLPGFMSTQTYPVIDGQALVFHKSDHLWVDAVTGKISKQVSLVDDVSVRRRTPKGYKTVRETLEDKARPITQQSNLLVGPYHYFRAYTRNYLGRVDTRTGEVEYLELPLQVLRRQGKPEQVLWSAELCTIENGSGKCDDLADVPRERWQGNLSYTSLRNNRVENSLGFHVSGDERAIGNGWGHTASPLPTAFDDRLYVPILSGVVFVIDAQAQALDESAVLATNDLGPLGNAFTRASITTDGKKIYAHTIREVIAVE